MIALLGFTSSGKSTIETELVKLGYNPLISYTTRQPRDYETDGIDYHFITEDEFIKKKDIGFFAETTSYNTAYGLAYYGSAKEDVSDDKVSVINVEGFKQLQQNKDLNITSFYIDVNEKTIIKRLKKRGDPKKEYLRRIGRDRIDLRGMEDKVDFVINGNFRTPHELALEVIEKDRFKRKYL